MTTIPAPRSPTSGLSPKYDAWNRLTEARTLTDSLVGAYAYDGLGQRIKKNTGGSTNHRDYYYNDQWQLLTEVKDGSVEAVYHWHPYYIDALAVRMRYQDTHFFLQDANFNVTAAVDDDGNAVVERYSYTPYGEVTFLDSSFGIRASSLINNNHLYTGRERDPETGLQLNRHRYYASHLGRWTNRDPIGYEGSPFSLYEYVSCKPTILVDAEGLATPIIGGGEICVDSSCSPIQYRPEDPYKPPLNLPPVAYCLPGKCCAADGAFGVDVGVYDGFFWTEITTCSSDYYKTSDGCTTEITCNNGQIRAETSCSNPASWYAQRNDGGCDKPYKGPKPLPPPPCPAYPGSLQ